MSIIHLQRRIAEVGRIRIGQQVASGGKKRPEKLTTFRLTSPNKVRVDQAARLYGGQPQQWDAPAGAQWEVVTQADALNVIVPPSDMAFSQHYELWSAGGCQRRCDGQTESISDGPCVCDPDNRECNIHTRLSVMLADLPGLGVWRIDTSGYYAAVELQGAVSVMQLAAARGQMLPAQLRLEQRMVKRCCQTRRFAVPVLDVEISPEQLVSGQQAVVIERDTGRVIEDGSVAALPAPSLTPVPESVPERPVASVAEQSTTSRSRRRSSQPVPSTGLMPRTAAQAESGDDAVTKPQLQKLSILRQRERYADDEQGRADWLAWVATNIGRSVVSNKELTKAEATVLIDVLETPTVESEPTEDSTDTVSAELSWRWREWREKWMASLDRLLAEADCPDPADQLIVVAKVAKTAELLRLDAVTDAQLRTAVNTLGRWSKAGELGSQITDLLNSASLAEAAETENANEEGNI